VRITIDQKKRVKACALIWFVLPRRRRNSSSFGTLMDWKQAGQSTSTPSSAAASSNSSNERAVADITAVGFGGQFDNDASLYMTVPAACWSELPKAGCH
jgi:hypothetical protein